MSYLTERIDAVIVELESIMGECQKEMDLRLDNRPALYEYREAESAMTICERAIEALEGK